MTASFTGTLDCEALIEELDTSMADESLKVPVFVSEVASG